MKTLLRFLKPYKALCFFTLLVMTLDVVGALYIPTLVADRSTSASAAETWASSSKRGP